MLSIEEFRQIIFESGAVFAKSWPCETINLNNTHGRIAYSPITSSVDVPPKDNSAMDGYALYCEDTISPGQVFDVSQIIPAGTAPPPLKPGTCARIFTGAEIPDGANTVVIQENTEIQNHSMTVREAIHAGQNIRPAGQDIRQGSTILKKGELIDAPKAGVLASCGINRVEVFQKPKVVFIATGNELVMPGTPLQPGQIYNSNKFLISNLLQNFGCDVVECLHLEDSIEASIEALKSATAKAQFIVSCGGVSVGDEDHIKKAVQTLGEIQQWKVKMKPGKPLVFAKLANKGSDATPFFGLPGNPVSSFVTACFFVRTFLQAAYGREYQPLNGYPLPSGFTVEAEQKRPEFRRCRIKNGKVETLENQSSGALSSVDQCEGLALLPSNKIIKQGDSIEFFPINNLMYM